MTIGSERTIRRVNRVVSVLSLDRARPYMGDLGLQALNRPQFFHELKLWMQKYFLADAVPGGSYPTGEALIESLSESLGTPLTHQFVLWANSLFASNASANLISWEYLLIQLCRSLEGWAELAIRPEIEEQLRIAALNASDDLDLDRRIDEDKSKPMSQWDLIIYATFAYDDDDNDPMLSIQLSVSHRRFQVFFATCERLLDRGEIDALVRSARVASARHGSPRDLAWPDLSQMPAL